MEGTQILKILFSQYFDAESNLKSSQYENTISQDNLMIFNEVIQITLNWHYPVSHSVWLFCTYIANEFVCSLRICCCYCYLCQLFLLSLLSGPMTRDSKFKVKLIDKRLREKVARHTNNCIQIYMEYKYVWRYMGKIVICRRLLDTLSEILNQYLIS